jgi:putative ABC transport system permease protein
LESLKLAWKNILADNFRSLAVFLCAALMAGLALGATFIVKGAEASMHANLQKMGADILILPWGTITDKIGGARLMSAAIDGWLPRSYLDSIASLEGVNRVSPQLHLADIKNSPYSPHPQIFLVAYDPETDFTLLPWAEMGKTSKLGQGQAILGSSINLPEGENKLTLFDFELVVAGRLDSTGTSIDQTVFVSFETAEEFIAKAHAQLNPQVRAVSGSISAIMVEVKLQNEPHDVAVRILEEAPGVVPLKTTGMLETERRQILGVRRTLFGILGGVWTLSVIFIGLVFTIAVNERKQEIGILQAIGLPKTAIVKVLLYEGALLALLGGAFGVLTVSITLELLGRQAVYLAGLPVYMPPLSGLVVFSLLGQALTLGSVVLAAFIPAWKISRMEVADVMRA